MTGRTRAFRGAGPCSRRLAAYLDRRSGRPASERPELDCRSYPRLFRKRAVVFTDTADFTVRTVRDGILHFLMLFDRVLHETAPAIRRARGGIVKVDGDSLLLRFPDVPAACACVDAIEGVLRRGNARRPENERMFFSYGIGFGDVLDLEGDVFGLEVNLASKLGEDLAEPGQALLTPAARAALPGSWRRRVSPYGSVRFGRMTVDVGRLRLAR